MEPLQIPQLSQALLSIAATQHAVAQQLTRLTVLVIGGVVFMVLGVAYLGRINREISRMAAEVLRRIPQP